MSTAAEVRIALEKRGQATIKQIARELGIAEGDPRWHKINQALSAGVGTWSQRVARGEYVWLNGSKPSAAPKNPPTTSAELQPLVDSLDDGAFDGVGLDYVARTQDGAFICIDQHGVAWRVEVTVTAKLI